MHLLKFNGDGNPSLTKFISGKIPSYAILSHTWEADNQEVTFKDLAEGVGTSKVGYRKIQFCGEQAQKDDLQYFWVDSCCIDKSSSAELSEAINSMFHWYRNAAKCYVYLSDISTAKRDRSSRPQWESSFRQSRWFTRGWTLQELLAPLSVEFFSREGKRLGDKKSLELQIHEITSIAVQALQGSPLSQFSVTERMSWAAKRETTIEEDQAYCLLGIFDIHLPLIYGEGIENAFRRLRKEISAFGGRDDPLTRLPHAVEAPFNSNQRQHDPTCLENTRVDLLQEIQKWADRQDARCIFWLNGLAGTGKSTIARTIAREYFIKQRLGASFFFSRGGGDVGYAGKFVTSIAVQLANSIPTFRQHVCDAITERSDIANQSLRDQWQQLVLGPLSKLDGRSSLPSYVLVVDALDECDDDNNIRVILHLLAEARLLLKARLRVFLTSRPEIPIRYGFCQIPDAEHQDFVLHSISPSIIDHDIYIFVEYNLNVIKQERSLDDGWPGEQVINRLVQKACGLFIWAATACRFVSEGRQFTERRLSLILQSGVSLTAPDRHLNEIYITILNNSVGHGYDDYEREELLEKLRNVLGSIVVLFSPLSAGSLSRLVYLTEQSVDQALEDLHAILDIQKDKARPLRLHHPSFRDFLLDKGRCGGSNFWVNEKRAHQTLAESCIRLMSTFLKQDICEQDVPSALVADVESSRVEQCVPPEVQYACLYWVEHLQKSGAQLCDNDRVHQFLQTHFLHWLEALSWMRKMSEGILAISSLESIALMSDCPRLYDFIHDIKRFALYGRVAIEQAPLQTYCSGLIFAPAKSIVRKQFEGRIPGWMRKLPKLPEDWGASLQTLEGHTNWVKSVAFSPDGALLASASLDKTVRLWDVATGAALKTLEGHTATVISIAFSRDSALLASASCDKTVRLWNAITGAALKTLEVHTATLISTAFSRDSALLASASCDKTVRLWDAITGAALKTLEGHTDTVNSVAFSPDGALLASGAWDRTVKLWDVVTEAALKTLEGHNHSVISIAFSRDGALLASGSLDRMVKLWDVVTGAALKTLKGHTNTVNLVTFSSDGALLASGSWDRTVKLWNVVTGAALKTLEGHNRIVISIAFSRDGALPASASLGRAVRLWDAASGAALNTIEDYPVHTLSFSSDGPFLVIDRGLLPLEGCRPLGVSPQPVPRTEVSLNGNWVVRNSEKLLWLPPEYRPACSAFRGNFLALGHRNGRVTVMEFG